MKYKSVTLKTIELKDLEKLVKQAYPAHTLYAFIAPSYKDSYFEFELDGKIGKRDYDRIKTGRTKLDGSHMFWNYLLLQCLVKDKYLEQGTLAVHITTKGLSNKKYYDENYR
jgi:hypothetical protein